MKTTILSILIAAFSLSALSSFGQATCVDPDLIDPTSFCITVFAPVCGCDDIEYSNSCFATITGGNTYWIDGSCANVAASCLAPARNLESIVTGSSVILEWEPPIANAAVAYRVRGRVAGTSSWNNGPVISAPTTTFVLPTGPLTSGTTYEWQVQASCAPIGALLAPDSELATFTALAPRVGEAMNIAAYPNPATSTLTVMHSSISPVDVVVHDQTGRIVYSGQADAQSAFGGFEIDVTNLPNGMYTVKINEGTEAVSTRIAVVH